MKRALYLSVPLCLLHEPKATQDKQTSTNMMENSREFDAAMGAARASVPIALYTLLMRHLMRCICMYLSACGVITQRKPRAP